MKPMTLAILAYNSASTLPEVLESVCRQTDAGDRLEKILLMDDASRDASPAILADAVGRLPVPATLVAASSNRGLAWSYNRALALTETPYLVIMHADVILQSPCALTHLLTFFQKNPEAIYVYSWQCLPMETYATYNFWQKVFFARSAGITEPACSGKFDAIEKKRFVAHFQGWNDRDYRTAGEDGDLIRRLTTFSDRALRDCPEVVIHHIHSRDPRFSWRHILRKGMQYNEAYGVHFRKTGFRHPAMPSLTGWQALRGFVRTYFRPMLVLGLAFHYLRWISLGLMVCYAIVYSAPVYRHASRNWRIVTVPLLNLAVLFLGTVMFLVGFFRGKQRL